MSSDKTSFQPYPPHKILTIILLEHHFTLVYSFQSLNNANRRECGRNKEKCFSSASQGGHPCLPYRKVWSALERGCHNSFRPRILRSLADDSEINHVDVGSGRRELRPRGLLDGDDDVTYTGPLLSCGCFCVSSRFSGIFLSQNKMRWLFPKPIKAAVLNGMTHKTT